MLAHGAKPAFHQREPSFESGGKRLSAGDGRGIPVQPHDPAGGGFQNGAAVAPRPERAVDIDGIIPGRERLQHLVKHDGDMTLLGLACFRGHFGRDFTVNKSLTLARHCPRLH